MRNKPDSIERRLHKRFNFGLYGMSKNEVYLAMKDEMLAFIKQELRREVMDIEDGLITYLETKLTTEEILEVTKYFKEQRKRGVE